METKKSYQEDNELIHRFLMGGDDAMAPFDKLVLKYKDMVFSLCYKFTGNYYDANDCAQDTFIKVFKSLCKFQFRSRFSTWLYRITVNTCKTYLSSLEYRMREKVSSIDKSIGDDPSSPGFEIKDDYYDPENIYEKNENLKLIMKAIESLPATQRVLIILRDMENKSYGEISHITGIKEGTVKSKLSRAREKLRKKLKGVI